MLKEIIEKDGRTQKQIALDAGIDPATLSRLVSTEDGLKSAKFETIVSACNTLKINPVELNPYLFEKGQDFLAQRTIDSYTLAELPAFSDNEKKYFADMLNGSIYTPAQHPREYLRHQIMDADHYDGLADKWEVSLGKFIEKVDGLTAAQAYLIIRIIGDWWAKEDRDLNKIF